MSKSVSRAALVFPVGGSEGWGYFAGIIGQLDWPTTLSQVAYYRAGTQAGACLGLIGYMNATPNNSFTVVDGVLGGTAGCDSNPGLLEVLSGAVVGVAESTDLTFTRVLDWAPGRKSDGAMVGGIQQGTATMTFTNAYFDEAATGLTILAPPGFPVVPVTNVASQGLTTAAAKDPASYAGWDFTNVWMIDPSTGYPALRGLPF